MIPALLSKRNYAFMLALLIPLLTSCGGDQPTDVGFGFRAGPILFVSNRTGTYQLYSMNEDGSNIKQLTDDSDFPIEYASWSPDGKKIAVNSQAGGVEYYGPAIHVMNSDGTGRYKLTQPSPEGLNYASGDRPAWSPDGKRLAFHRVMIPESRGNTDLFVIDADGTHERRLTKTNDAAEYVGSWSSDGRFLYFAYFDFGRAESTGVLTENSHLARIDLARDSIEVISPPLEIDSGPVTSPDDSLIVFSFLDPFRTGPGAGRPLYIMRSNGTNRRKLTGNDYRYESAVGWSSDGKRILYNGENDEMAPYENPPRDILIIGTDGTRMHKITPFDFKEAVSVATSWRKE